VVVGAAAADATDPLRGGALRGPRRCRGRGPGSPPDPALRLVRRPRTPAHALSRGNGAVVFGSDDEE